MVARAKRIVNADQTCMFRELREMSIQNLAKA